MRFTTKLFTLGALGAATYGAVRALQKSRSGSVDSLFDASDVRDTRSVSDTTDVGEPMIVSEAVVLITEDDPDAIDDLFAFDPVKS